MKRGGQAMKLGSTVAVAAFLLFRCPVVFTQNSASPQRPSDGGTREVLVSILIPSISGAPFAATVNTTVIRQLPNGAQVTLVNQRRVARDKAGRIFQERRMLVPQNRVSESIVTQIEISDPVKHELYICQPRERVCQLEEFHPPEGTDISLLGREPSGPGIEHLGKQTIEGFETRGVRQTVTIETNRIGNDRPLYATREYWYAEKLGINLLSMRDGPESEKQEFRVSDVSVSDPDPALFQPPAGTTILDLRKPAVIPSESRQ